MDMMSGSLHIFTPSPQKSDSPSVRILPRHLSRPARGVLFDMCNILYDDTVWRRWLLRLLTQIGLHTSYRSFFHLWDRDCLDAVHRGQRTFDEAFESFLRSLGMSRGQIEEVEAASRSHRRTMEESLRALPGVKATIARLADSGTVLGAICNSELPATALRHRIERFGLGDRFKAVISSIDLGVIMPDGECYIAALRAMGLPADEVAFVGHDAAELAGASAVGMATIALNFAPEAQADVHLSRIEELPAVLTPSPVVLAAAG